MEQKTQIHAEEGRQDLTIIRNFDLPVDLVFQAHNDAALLEQWMGTKVVQWNHKKHGYFQFETAHNGKVMFRANGCFHEVVPNEKIIRTFEMEGAPIGAQLEIITFEKTGENTSKLTLHIIFQSEKHRAEQLKIPFAYGINVAHNKLESIFNQNKKS